ncbi:MAG: undecaprenyl-phosphate glucose phosphotransferase [Rhizobiales bacterium]|nr:undecaprenyl-phosphate glucose phosphotransferase [Hyphomicrobiales bacterium]MBI3673096.1 undecaprenyl-phosphate glucose phosphotransferase [Hyphomicrobiales bacterium]
MRPNPDNLARLAPSDVLDRLEIVPVQPLERLREVGIGTLSRAPHVSTRVVTSLIRAGECLIIGGLGFLIAGLHTDADPFDLPGPYLPLILAVALALPAVAQSLGLYSIKALLRPAREVTRLAAAWSLIFAVVTVAMFLGKLGDNYSRVWLSVWFIAGLALLICYRAATALLVRHWNRNGQLDRRAVLVGGGAPAADLVRALEASRNIDVAVVGVFDDRDDNRSPATIGALPKLGNVSELLDFVRRARIDVLIVTLPLAAEERLLQILKRLWVLPVDIRLSAYSQKLFYRPRAYSYIGNVPFLDVFDKPLGDWGRLLKAIEDKLIAAAAMALLSPVMLLVALAIRLESRGPVLFRQKRYGFNNELIEVLKFRSMYHDMRDADAARLVTKDDRRVTRVGRFIRRTSLDELPQLFNVLRGELSLVGPRPHATKAKAADRLYNDVVDGYFARHKVKPGITGWAQINGWRGETDTADKLQRRVEHDLYYIENWSLALDLLILWRTPWSLLKGDGAY